jgi:hypothetical protein
MVARYMEFGRQILSALDTNRIINLDESLVVLCKGFHLTELLKKKLKKAEPAKQAEKGKKATKEEVKEGAAPELIKKASQFLPTFTVPTHAGTGGDRVKLVYPSQSAKDKASYTDQAVVINQLSKKDRNVLTKMVDDIVEDKIFLNSDAYRTAARKLSVDEPKFGDPSELHKLCETAFKDTPLTGRGSIVALKQFTILKNENRLLKPNHLKSTLHTMASLGAAVHPKVDATWNPEDFQSLVRANPKSEEEIKADCDRPRWKGAQNLGRCHPRILALQVSGSDAEQGLNELFVKAFLNEDRSVKPYWHPILQEQQAFQPSGATTKVAVPKPKEGRGTRKRVKPPPT